MAGLAVVLALATLAVAEPDAPRSLTECYQAALARSETVGITAAELAAAEARYMQAQDRLWPQVDLFGSARTEDAGADRVAAGVRGSQVLFSGFRITRQAEARQAEADAAALDLTRSRELLYLDVSDIFHEALQHQRDRAVLHELAAALEETDVEIGRRIELGRARLADRARARADVADVQATIAEVEGRWEAALELVAFLTGFPAESLALADPGAPPAAPSLEEALASAARRADVLAARMRTEGAAREVEAARAERRPLVAADAELRVTDDPDRDGHWSAGISVALPLFDDGGIDGRVREQEARMRSARLAEERLTRFAATEVRSAMSAFRSAAARSERLAAAAELAEENVALQREDYSLGRAGQLDVTSALAQLHNLRRRVAIAELDAWTNWVRLRVASGEVSP